MYQRLKSSKLILPCPERSKASHVAHCSNSGSGVGSKFFHEFFQLRFLDVSLIGPCQTPVKRCLTSPTIRDTVPHLCEGVERIRLLGEQPHDAVAEG